MARRTVGEVLLLIALCAVARPAGARMTIAERWRDLSPQQRYRTLQNYWQHQHLPADRQREIERRYERWRGMSPEERSRIQQNYQRFQQLPPQEREQFQRKYEHWRQKGDEPRH
ncbi:MAG: DUF3106 domain-containing protein [Candidatus Binatia bacterium]